VSSVSQNVLSQIIGYYLDSEAKRKAPRGIDGGLQLDFGKIIQGRLSKTITLYARNEHVYTITLESKTTDPDLLFLTYPKQLEPGQIGKVELAFRVPMDRIKPLDHANWGFDLTIMPRG
jgi:hypothetical protein